MKTAVPSLPHMAWPSAHASWFLLLAVLHWDNPKVPVSEQSDYLHSFMPGKGELRQNCRKS